MPAIGARAGHDAAKRFVEWIRYRDDELNEPSAAVGRQQSQKKPQPQQGIKHKEDVIDNLRDAGHATCTSHFTLCLDDFVDGFGAELTGNLIYSLAFRRWRAGSAFSNLSLHFPFDLRLDRAVLPGAP